MLAVLLTDLRAEDSGGMWDSKRDELLAPLSPEEMASPALWAAPPLPPPPPSLDKSCGVNER